MTVGAPPVKARLPDGFAVELDPRVRRLDGGRVLLGAAPTRLLRLSAQAAGLLATGPLLRVCDGTTAALARRLLDTGAAHPRPPESPTNDVTVVVPVRDRPGGLDRLLTEVRRTAGQLPVIVVDDGSQDAAAAQAVCSRHAGTLIRHEVARGPAAARNTGLAAAGTPYAVLLDSDCLPLEGWLSRLRDHLADPLVAAVAPRIVAAPAAPSAAAASTASGWLARYEAAASSLDLGPCESLVSAHTGVPYVPSAALLVRRAALGDGYDESMHVAEDVDLAWRLVGAGWRVRYEPAAQVAHQHRTTIGAWLRRRAYYGTGAAPLAARHDRAVAPLVLSPWSAAAWAALIAGCPAGALGILVWATHRLARRLDGIDPGRTVAARLVGLGTLYAGRQLASAATRHYWPLSLAAALLSRPARRLLAAVAVVDGMAAWWPHRAQVPGPLFLVMHRLDDLGYGAGLWWGVCRSRSLRALRPKIGRI